MTDSKKIFDMIRSGEANRARLLVSATCKNLPDHIRLVFLSELNAMLYSLFMKNFDADLKEVIKKNRILILSDSKDKSYIVMNYASAYINEIAGFKNSQIDLAKKYISEHLSEKLSLSKVAREIHISKNYLCKLFSDETGYTFCSYINKLRIEKAEKLIITTDLPLDIIGQMCGYHSQTHFSTTFKKHKGISPLQHRQNAEKTVEKYIKAC